MWIVGMFLICALHFKVVIAVRIGPGYRIVVDVTLDHDILAAFDILEIIGREKRRWIENALGMIGSLISCYAEYLGVNGSTENAEDGD
jgi:hypothetical protein